MAMRQHCRLTVVHGFLDTLFGDDLQRRAGASLLRWSHASDPVRRRWSVGLIGQGLARGARPRLTEHAVEQVDRLVVQPRHRRRCPAGPSGAVRASANATSVTVAMDWTEFDADGQATDHAVAVACRGRATPLVSADRGQATLEKPSQRRQQSSGAWSACRTILPAEVRVRNRGRSRLRRPTSSDSGAERDRSSTHRPLRGDIAVTATDGEHATSRGAIASGRPAARANAARVLRGDRPGVRSAIVARARRLGDESAAALRLMPVLLDATRRLSSVRRSSRASRAGSASRTPRPAWARSMQCQYARTAGRCDQCRSGRLRLLLHTALGTRRHQRPSFAVPSGRMLTNSCRT